MGSCPSGAVPLPTFPPVLGRSSSGDYIDRQQCTAFFGFEGNGRHPKPDKLVAIDRIGSFSWLVRESRPSVIYDQGLTMRVTNAVIAIAFLLTAAALASMGLAEAVDDPEMGYSIQIPNGWREIPKPVVNRLQEILIKPGAKVDFVFYAAYEPATHSSYFDFPYMLVEQAPNPGGVERTTITEDDLRAAAATFSGSAAGTAQATREDLTTQASKQLGDMQYQGATYSTQPPAVSFGISVSTPGGQVHADGKLLIGRHRRLAIFFYTSGNDPYDYSPVQQEIANSFHLDPREQTVLGTGAPSEFDHVLPAAIAGALGTLIASLFARSRRRRRAPSADDGANTISEPPR
jgi:hypothetical protein